MNVVIELRRHLYLLVLFAKNSLLSQMEYRFNFVAGIFVETAFLMAKLLYVSVVYQTNVHVDGMTPDTILMFMGTHILLTGLYMGLFYNNFLRITEYVRTGMLDLMMVKPVSLQFLVSFRYIETGMPLPISWPGLSWWQLAGRLRRFRLRCLILGRFLSFWRLRPF